MGRGDAHCDASRQMPTLPRKPAWRVTFLYVVWFQTHNAAVARLMMLKEYPRRCRGGTW